MPQRPPAVAALRPSELPWRFTPEHPRPFVHRCPVPRAPCRRQWPTRAMLRLPARAGRRGRGLAALSLRTPPVAAAKLVAGQPHRGRRRALVPHVRLVRLVAAPGWPPDVAAAVKEEVQRAAHVQVGLLQQTLQLVTLSVDASGPAHKARSLGRFRRGAMVPASPLLSMGGTPSGARGPTPLGTELA